MNDIQLSRVDLNLLVLFQAVIEYGHVGRAAEYLNLSPSAVSHGLRRLRRLLNDPLFLRTPKGVVPTARARELAEPVADVLGRVGGILATSRPFDPAVSRRSFAIGAPDGISAVVVPPLLATLARLAPGVDVRVRQLLPVQGETQLGRAWRNMYAELDSRENDVAIVPFCDVPQRFRAVRMYDEEFVIAMRAGHPFARSPTLDRFCASSHVLVSMTGEAWGVVDQALAAVDRSRRIALTLPDFHFALDCVAKTDFLAALPRRLASANAERLGIVFRSPPFALDRYSISAVVSEGGLTDPGLAWFHNVLTSLDI
jgi:DNA-binding transcriptional LysR family regulator